MFPFIFYPCLFLFFFWHPIRGILKKLASRACAYWSRVNRNPQDLRLYTDSTHGLLEPKKKLKTCTFSLSLFHTGPLVLCKRVKPKVGDNNSCHTNHMKWQRKRSPFKAIKSYISIIILTNTKTSGPRQFRLVNWTQSAFLQKKYIWRQPSLSKMNGRKSEFVIWLTFWFIRFL